MRAISSQIPDFVKKLVSDPYEFLKYNPPLSIQQLEELKRYFVKQESKKPNFIILGSNFNDTLVIGDIHGDLKSVVKIVKHFQDEKVGSLVFLGDYVDRGKHSLLVFAFILSLAISWPNRIQILKGNHEDWVLNKKYGFQKEIYELFHNSDDQQDIQEILMEIYDNISLCAITPSKSFCCHGGIPEGLQDLNDFNKIVKPHSNLARSVDKDDLLYLNSLYRQINWNDPLENQESDFEQSYRGHDIYMFNESATNKFLKLADCKRIIRAHESSRGGFQSIFEGKILHVFSSEPYFDKIKEATVVHETIDKTVIRKLNYKIIKEIE